MHITEDKRAEIRQRADIVDIISERIVLKKAGKDFVGLCPFHSEKTPSFMVSPSKQIYHCFGCGAGGDVFSFVMKYEGIGFPEALMELARRYGVDLPARSVSLDSKTVSEKQQLFDINQRVMHFYKTQLMDPRVGESARQYLQHRGIGPKIMEAFELGFALDGWNQLTQFLTKSKIPLHLAAKAGLIIPKENKGYYDRFRNRIIFPILDEKRRVIGFGGRVLDDSKPKYLNSPESPIYHKGKTLYGVHASKDKCRETETVFIVEGYFDLMALHQHGFTNAVATLGTALTSDHVRMLKRGFAKKIFLVFDSDSAGVKAAHRSIPLFINESVSASVVILPKGYDPDSFLIEKGAQAFQEAADQAFGMMDFLLESAVLQYGLTVEGKIRIITEMADPLSQISDSVARAIYIRHLAERIGVDESVALEKIKIAAMRANQLQQKAARRDAHPAGGNEVSGAHERTQIISETVRIEKKIVAMMVQYPDILPQVKKSGALNLFQDDNLKRLGEMILQKSSSRSLSCADFMNQIEDEALRQMLASLIIVDEKWEQRSCENLLNQFVLSRKRKQAPLLNRIKAAEESNDQELLMQLLKEKQEQALAR